MWVCGIFAIIASMLPGWTDQTGRSVSVRELWSEGIGPMIIVYGMIFMLIGSLIYIGRTWVRHLLMIGIIVAGLSSFYSDDYKDLPFWLIVTVAGVGLFLAVRYFYFRPEIVSYFTRNNRSAESGPRE